MGDGAVGCGLVLMVLGGIAAAVMAVHDIFGGKHTDIAWIYLICAGGCAIAYWYNTRDGKKNGFLVFLTTLTFLLGGIPAVYFGFAVLFFT
jgi:hypothetical protein